MPEATLQFDDLILLKYPVNVAIVPIIRSFLQILGV